MMRCDVALCLLPASESAACTHGCDFARVTAAICSSFKASAGEVKQIVVGGTWEGGGQEVQGCGASIFHYAQEVFKRDAGTDGTEWRLIASTQGAVVTPIVSRRKTSRLFLGKTGFAVTQTDKRAKAAITSDCRVLTRSGQIVLFVLFSSRARG